VTLGGLFSFLNLSFLIRQVGIISQRKVALEKMMAKGSTELQRLHGQLV
jgi:hypothetical protein